MLLTVLSISSEKLLTLCKLCKVIVTFDITIDHVTLTWSSRKIQLAQFHTRYNHAFLTHKL